MLELLENRSRRNNLCSKASRSLSTTVNHGVSAKTKLKNLFETNLQLDADDIKIELAHRVGTKKQTGKSSVAKFLKYKDHDTILMS